MSAVKALLATGVACFFSFTTPGAMAQETEDEPVLCMEDAATEAVIFRYKVGLVATDCSVADDEDDGDDEEEDSPSGSAKADYRYDPGTLSINGSAPNPLSVSIAGKNIDPDANGLTWQCFQADGGYGNYFWVLDQSVGGDDSWIESFDIVVSSDVSSTQIPNSSYSWAHVAPPHDPAQSRFGIDHVGEVCVRVKAAPEATGGGHAYLNLNIEDMSSDQVSDGSMSEGSFWGASSYGSLEVTVCYEECPPIQFEITGPTSFEMIAGSDEWNPWSTNYGHQPIQWTLIGAPGSMQLSPDEWGDHFLEATETGTFPVTVHATDDTGQTAELAVVIDVTEPPALEIFGPTEVEIEIGLHNNFWYAEGGSGDYTWEVLGPPVLSFEEEWSDYYFRGSAAGTYGDDPEDKVFIVVKDGNGDEDMLEVVVTVVRPDPGLIGWGDNSGRQLALGAGSSTVYSPEESYYADKAFTKLAGASSSSCGIAEGDLYCWSRYGNIGLGSGVSQDYPDTALSPQGGWTWVDASFNGSICGIRNGDLYCWGSNSYHQLGLGSSTSTVHTPTMVSSGGWTRVAPGARFTCGIRSGDMYCWGETQDGVGNGSSEAVYTPVQVGPSGGWTEVDSGQAHTCAIRNGGMYCWGHGSERLGRGVNSIPGPVIPEPIANDPGGWSGVAVGAAHSCGLRGAEIRCWGENPKGQLGDGTTDDRNIAIHAIQPGGFAAITAGQHHTCASTAGGELYCWGEGWRGALGHGTGNDSITPVRIGPEWDFGIIAAGANHMVTVAQRNGWEETVDPEPEFDPGRPCGNGGSGSPVCEDDSPPSDDHVYHGHVPLYFSSYAEYYTRQFSAPWKGQHSVRVTGWSSQSVTDSGMPFSYVCWRPQGGGTIWQYGSNTNTLRSIVPRWIVRHDVVPRRDLFSGDVLEVHPDNWVNSAYYPWTGDHDVVGAPENYWDSTTNERDMCSRLVVDEADPNGDQWDSVSPAALGLVTIDGDFGDEYMMIISSVWITPGLALDFGLDD